MTQTSLPEKQGSAATSSPPSQRCPGCGREWSWIIATMGGSSYYQPCGCYAGELKR